MRLGRTRGSVAALALAIAALAPVRAEAGPEEAERLRKEGDAFARARRFEEAIAAFKKAEREEPRADHDCFIALAYRRLERWGQAEMFHTRCRERVAAAGGAEPVWSAQVAGEIRDGLAKSGHARVSIAVEPSSAAAGALVTVSSYAPDESFAPPRTVWLPPGKHLVEATAPGMPGGSLTVSVAAGSDQAVVVSLEAPAAAQPTPPGAVGETPSPAAMVTAGTPAPARAGRGPLMWIALGGGAVAIAAGVTFNILALRNQERLRDATTDEEYREHETAFDVERAATYISYGIGATALAFGVYLYFTGAPPDDESSVRVGAAPTAGGGAVMVEWRR